MTVKDDDMVNGISAYALLSGGRKVTRPGKFWMHYDYKDVFGHEMFEDVGQRPTDVMYRQYKQFRDAFFNKSLHVILLKLIMNLGIIGIGIGSLIGGWAPHAMIGVTLIIGGLFGFWNHVKLDATLLINELLKCEAHMRTIRYQTMRETFINRVAAQEEDDEKSEAKLKELHDVYDRVNSQIMALETNMVYQVINEKAGLSE